VRPGPVLGMRGHGAASGGNRCLYSPLSAALRTMLISSPQIIVLPAAPILTNSLLPSQYKSLLFLCKFLDSPFPFRPCKAAWNPRKTKEPSPRGPLWADSGSAIRPYHNDRNERAFIKVLVLANSPHNGLALLS